MGRARATGLAGVVALVVAGTPAVSAAAVDAAPPVGAQLKQSSQGPSLSANGTKIAFVTSAPVLKGDAGGADVFVKDLRTGAVVRASAARGGAGANDDSSDPSISADGTKVAFTSTATNLVPGDTNRTRDIFVKDLRTGVVVRASTTASGGEVALGAKEPSLSADGKKVAFTSPAPDLVAGDTNGQNDVFVKDLKTGALDRASDGDSAGGPALSADGTHVAFWQYAAAKLGAKDKARDVYVKNLAAGTATLASVRKDGGEADGESSEPSLSANGRRVAFTSFASNLVDGDANGAGDVFVKDLKSGAVHLASAGTTKGAAGNFTSELPSLSADGNLVAFMSYAPNLVRGDTNATEDVFVMNLRTRKVVRASTTARGAQIEGACYEPSLAGSGASIAFSSSVADFVPRDTNGVQDVFVKTLKSGTVVRASTKAPAKRAN